MRKTLLTLFVALLATSVFAQQRGTLTAKVVDAGTGEGVPGAVVTITSAKTPDKPKQLLTAYAGALSVPSLAYGDYTLEISFLGYETHKSEFRIGASKLDLGTLELKEGLRIETVVKEAQLRTSQKGDTVSYNAGAFKVTSDADVERLLKKMPGITVTDGTVEAQGEEVKKVFVDGKEFFGEDVTTAIKSLPAQAVDRVEVYNKLSDAAEFSGMDDGEGYKAINIVTHANMRQGQFGKLYAGYGYDADTKTESQHKYIAGGNVNIFQGDTRISLIGLFNNVNQQNFSFEDILNVSGGGGGGRRPGGVGQYMMRPQSGVARVNAFGVNFSDTWGKRDQVSVQGSYFFNNTNTRNTQTIDKWYEPPMMTDTLSTIGYSDTRAYNHRANARIEWKISENQNLMVRPSFSYQTNDPWSTTEGWQFGQSGYSRTDNYNESTNNGYNLRLAAVYRAKLGKAGRTITIDANGSYSDSENDARSWSNQMGLQPARPGTGPFVGTWDPAGYTDLRYLKTIAPSTSHSLRANATYTEPVSKHAQVSLQYRFSLSNSERDKRSYITADDNFDIAGLEPDRSLSNAYESSYKTHSVGPGFRFSKERNTFIANLYYQHAQLDGQIVRDDAERISHDYDFMTYFMMGQLQINRENSLRLFVTSYTNAPQITNLQSVYDVSNAQSISRGNPDLDPLYSHNINFHYTNSNVEKGRTFMWMFSTQFTQDYNATHTVQNPGAMIIDGKEYSPNYYSMPVNLDGYKRLRTHISYGLPIGFLKSNFNVSAGVGYTQTPSILGGTVRPDGSIEGGMRNDTEQMDYDGRAVLGSNISENVDFTLSWNGTYTETTNSYDDNRTKNRYFNHSAQASMKFVLPLGFTLTASAAYNQYIGFTNDYDESYLLCNVFVGKKLFKNKRGEILFGVNDLLNQNTAFARSVGSGWTQNATNSVIGRYYMVQFTYNLRRFGKKGSTNLRDYGISESSGGNRRMMGPGGPGGPPPHGGFGGPR